MIARWGKNVISGAERRSVLAVIRFVVLSQILTSALGSLGCRSSIESSTHRSVAAPSEEAPPEDVPPSGEPVELPGSLDAARKVYQSRSVVSLVVGPGAIAAGDQFSLFNETTKASLIESGDSTAALDDTTLQMHGWSLLGADGMTLKLYLLDPALLNKVAPGENQLRLLVTSAGDGMQHSARMAIKLRDFPAFGFTTGTFDTGEQRKRGFQGTFEPFARSMVTSAGQAYLSTGFLSICNQ